MAIRIGNPRSVLAAASAELDRPMRIAAAAAFAVLLAHWLFILAFVVPRLGGLGFLRLHYTAAHGIDWVAGWQAIFTFPGIGLAAFFVNVALAAALAKNHRALGRIVLGAAVLVEVLLAAGGVLAVLLNG
jgi:hypothetical protein